MRKLMFLVMLLAAREAYAEFAPPPVHIQKDNFHQTGSQYMRTIYDNRRLLDVTDTNPNGNRDGRTNEVVIYNAATGPTLWLNIDGKKFWRQVL